MCDLAVAFTDAGPAIVLCLTSGFAESYGGSELNVALQTVNVPRRTMLLTSALAADSSRHCKRPRRREGSSPDQVRLGTNGVRRCDSLARYWKPRFRKQ